MMHASSTYTPRSGLDFRRFILGCDAYMLGAVEGVGLNLGETRTKAGRQDFETSDIGREMRTMPDWPDLGGTISSLP